MKRFLSLIVIALFAIAGPVQAGTKTVTVTHATSYQGDAGVSMSCGDSCGGARMVIPGPFATTTVYTVTCPNSGLKLTAKCKVFRGPASAPTVESAEATGISDTPFPLDGPTGVSVP